MKYNPDIHHRRSIRMREYDYSANGAYFVTICTQARECLFGDIADGVMHLNDAGRMVEAWWQKLPMKFDTVTVDTHIIMPNHFHGIIMMNDCRGESCIRPPCIRPPFESHVSANNNCDHKDQGDHKDRPCGTTAGSVGRIVQAFKSMTTNAYINGVKQSGWTPFPGRLWQRNYYERIIRNEDELAATREYIMYNPMKWAEDDENPES